ncbi:MAG: hypothetical protein JXR48_10445 [Candidatus Delongbacteria bacterium]|nr:hypothetical protein [Candidatus Delongbacteria bacterium]MBN2835375.1 hypothetical protein [Candidatus Delongbacteria bacterium]
MKIPRSIFFSITKLRNRNGSNIILTRYKRKVYYELRLIRKRGLRIPKYSNESTEYIRKFSNYNDLSWHKYYSSLNKILSPLYFPTDLFYTTVEPLLNDMRYAVMIGDKAFLTELFNEQNCVPTLLKKVKGRFFTCDGKYITEDLAKDMLLNLNSEYILKQAVGTGGGKDIVFFNKSSIDETFEITKSVDYFVIQKLFEQEESIKEFHPSSLNTIRMTTLRVDDKIHLLSSFIRFGNCGNKVDNATQKGVYCGIDKNGSLKNIGYDYYYNFHKVHPFSKKVFEGFKIPSYDKCLDLVTKCHNKIPYMDMISWDVAIGIDKNPKIVEINVRKQGIDAHQITNGPLFGEFSSYISELIFKRKAKK